MNKEFQLDQVYCYYPNCKKFESCELALTDLVIKAAAKIQNSIFPNIVVFSSEPECFEDNEK